MQAIVYKSRTGHTERYARLLSERTGVAAYSLSEAVKRLEKGARVIFMGWQCARTVKGLKSAARRFELAAVCVVGMGLPVEGEEISELVNNPAPSVRMFYLRGGLDGHRRAGFYGTVIMNMRKTVVPALERKADKTEGERALLDVLKNGGDFVSAENLEPLLDYLGGTALLK